jgi:hypothetical protein
LLIFFSRMYYEIVFTKLFSSGTDISHLSGVAGIQPTRHSGQLFFPSEPGFTPQMNY